MKVQKHISVQGEWAKVNVDLSNGDLIKIASEGEKVSGDFGERDVFKVETKNGIKNLSFNQTTMNNLIDALGDETNEWQGEKVKVWVVNQNVSGKFKDIVYLTAPNWLKGEDGFYAPEKEKDDIPVIEEEIDTKDIPF